jgi:hypothetical protein
VNGYLHSDTAVYGVHPDREACVMSPAARRVAAQQNDGQASHMMPIGVLPGQVAGLWEELCAARREIERLRQERDALLAERFRFMLLASQAGAGQSKGNPAG